MGRIDCDAFQAFKFHLPPCLVERILGEWKIKEGEKGWDSSLISWIEKECREDQLRGWGGVSFLPVLTLSNLSIYWRT
jgi:hypothetical protein